MPKEPALVRLGHPEAAKLAGLMFVGFGGALLYKFVLARWVSYVFNKWGAAFIFMLLAVIVLLTSTGTGAEAVYFFLLGLSYGAVGDDSPRTPKALKVSSGVVY
jgi:hypothetical protein